MPRSPPDGPGGQDRASASPSSLTSATPERGHHFPGITIEVARQDTDRVRDTVDQQEFPGRFERRQVSAQGESVLAHLPDRLLEGHQDARLPG